MKIKFKKIGFCSLFTFLFLISASAQWQGTGGNIYYNNGNVGIGTTTPEYKLDINGSIRVQNSITTSSIGAVLDDYMDYDSKKLGNYSLNWSFDSWYPGAPTLWMSGYAGIKLFTARSPRLSITSGGYVGIGTTTPEAILHVHQPQLLGHSKTACSHINAFSAKSNHNNVYKNLWLIRDANGSDWVTTRLHDAISVDVSYLTPGVNTKTWWERDPYDNIQSWGNDKDTYMTINRGNVGIGTDSPTELLDVRGKIRANEIIVNTLGADFVFADDYRLRPLQEVEQFITENKHLPDIASADSMAENGVGVSEMQTKLLQKVEELTLYVIEQEKELREQRREIERLKLTK